MYRLYGYVCNNQYVHWLMASQLKPNIAKVQLSANHKYHS